MENLFAKQWEDHFLIVDDNLFNIEVLQAIIKHALPGRMQIDTATGGEEAIEKVSWWLKANQ